MLNSCPLFFPLPVIAGDKVTGQSRKHSCSQINNLGPDGHRAKEKSRQLILLVDTLHSPTLPQPLPWEPTLLGLLAKGSVPILSLFSLKMWLICLFGARIKQGSLYMVISHSNIKLHAQPLECIVLSTISQASNNGRIPSIYKVFPPLILAINLCHSKLKGVCQKLMPLELQM